MTRIAINGMGRIGRAAFKQIIDDGALELAAVNDLVPAEELAYLLKHDSVYGRYGRDVRAQSGRLVVDSQSCVALNEKNLEKLPWRDLAVDIVLECTGVFTHEVDLKRHAQAGAKFVILSAPLKGGDNVPTVVHGVNTADGSASIISCASCTTNCITPVIEILGRRLGILKGDHDHDPCVYGKPGAGRPVEQGPSPRTGSGHQLGPSEYRGGEGHHQGAARIPREVRWRGDPCSGARRVDRGHRLSGGAADQH